MNVFKGVTSVDRPKIVSRSLGSAFCAFLIVLSLSANSIGGKVLLLGDDWMLSDYAFDLDPHAAATLADSVVEFLVGEGPASFLVISDTLAELPFGPRGVLGSELANWMSGQGHSWTIDPLADITHSALAPYSAVMLAGQAASGAENGLALQQYVLAGGSVLLMGGTGDFGSAQSEAEAWSPFLNRFGLSLGVELVATNPGALAQLPVQDGVGPFSTTASNVVWGHGQQALANTAEHSRTNVLLHGDFSGFGGGPQGSLNDLVVAYESPFLAGDFNDDGTVDAADYTTWRDALGTAALLAGDATPESIGGADHDTWRLNYGRTAPSALHAAARAVPEPCGVGFVAMSILLSGCLGGSRT